MSVFGLRRLRRAGVVALPLVALAVTASTSAQAAPSGGGGSRPPTSSTFSTSNTFPVLVPGAGVKASSVTAPGPLPTISGTVPVTGTTTKSRTSKTATVSAAAAVAATTTDKVALRALVIGLDASDWGIDTFKATLDRVGAAYDVLNARTTPLTADSLVRADGTGKYNAILLTSGSLLYQDPTTGGFLSAFDGVEWNALWDYERAYGVRQAVLYNSYGTFPEDYCLRAGTEGGVGATPLTATLTAAGATPFSYLKAGAAIPLVQSYVYRDTVAAGCNATSVLTAGANTLGVLAPSADGRERLSLTFTSNVNLLQSNLLVYGLFRWASKGLFLGEQKHYLNVDVDDWFNTSDEINPTTGLLGTWSMRASDAYNASLKQASLRAKYPLASGFTMGMAFNGGDANLAASNLCSPFGGVAQLTAETKCLKNTFRWINHTLTHPKLNSTDYATNLTEIKQNLTVAGTLGLPVDGTVLKTPEYSGLGVYNPNPTNDIDPPTDFGLAASNVALLQAATDSGVKYLHGNMSFASHRPSCFNCAVNLGIAFNNSTATFPNLNLVPDWPTNIAYYATTPAEETYFYNLYYGPGGKFPFYPTAQTYAQVIGNESDQALLHLSSGSVNTHTFHIGNLRNYGVGNTLLTDWADATIGKYAQYYSVPLLSQGWPGIAQYAVGRSAHFAELSAGVDAVYDRAANTVTVTSPSAGSVVVTGARTAGFTTYGNESSATIQLAAGTPVVSPPTLLP